MKGHRPERTCVVCREKKCKELLLRIVRRPGGGIEIDTEQQKTGRGAYLCKRRTCLENAVKRHLTQRCFRLPPPEGFNEQLIQYADGAD